MSNLIQGENNQEGNTNLIKERNKEIKELMTEMEILSSSWSSISELIHFQGQSLDILDQEMEKVKENTEKGKISLEKSVDYVSNRLIVVRDVSIVVGTGLLGMTGFLLGPLVGIGTLAAGIAGGSVAVAGLHNKDNKK